MIRKDDSGDVDISGIPFDPDYTFTSGQTFRWTRVLDGGQLQWRGVINGFAVRITKNRAQCLGTAEGRVESDFSELIYSYLSSKDDLKLINESFPREPYLQGALREFDGLRILKQDPWECLLSFICSINKNIPSIADAIERLSVKFGKRIETTGEACFSFPTPRSLAKASKSDLVSCKVGFRWRYIQHAARQVASGIVDLQSLSRRTYDEGRRDLIAELSGKTFGVGPKVADCVLLFSLHKLEAFPLDVWMLRCIREKYPGLFEANGDSSNRGSLTLRRYEAMHDAAMSYFGPYCGYAQQYLYMKVRRDSYSK